MSPQSPSILSQLPSEGALNQTKILKEKIHLLVISDEEEMMKLERMRRASMMHVHLPTQVNAFELSENTDLAHQLTPAQQFFSAWPKRWNNHSLD